MRGAEDPFEPVPLHSIFPEPDAFPRLDTCLRVFVQPAAAHPFHLVVARVIPATHPRHILRHRFAVQMAPILVAVFADRARFSPEPGRSIAVGIELPFEAALDRIIDRKPGPEDEMGESRPEPRA